ncbi:MAG: protein kinase [Planctomycetaceae bacterium]|nr:protein kinase [Planctomycetaceae bacterium]
MFASTTQSSSLDETGSIDSTDPARSSSSILLGNEAASAISTHRRTLWHAMARVGVQAADGLDYAHKRGILHRDIKPANLILDQAGIVWITDFGLARIESEENLTRTGDVMGTLRYMPPEALQGTCDNRSDIFSLGLTLYELLALRPGYNESNRNTLIQRITEASVPPLREEEPGIPLDLETIVHKCLDREPSGRYQSAGDLRDDLERFLQDEPIRARRVSPIERLIRWARRNKGIAASLAAILLLLLTASIASFLAAERFSELAEEKTDLADQREAQRRTAVAATELAKEKQNEAEEQELAAYDARDESRRRQREADAAKQQAEQLAEQNRRQLYTSQMLVAADALKIDTGIGRVRQILDNWLPRPGEPDLRGWEWYYLLGLCHQEAASLPDDITEVRGIAWNPTGDGLLVAHNGSYFSEYGSDWAAVRHRAQASGGAIGAAWNPDRTRLVACGYDGQLRIISWPDGEVLAERPLVERYQRLGWSSDGRWIACACDNRPHLLVLNANDGQEALRLDVEVNSPPFAFHPTQPRLAFRNGWTTRVVDIPDGTETASFEHPRTSLMAAINWSPDGSRLVECIEGAVRTRDAETGDLLRETRVDGYLADVDWHAEGGIAVASRDGTASIVDATTGEIVRQFRGHRNWVNYVKWSNDGSRLASGGPSDPPRIWNLSQSTGDLDIPGNYWSGSSWSPDSRTLAVAVEHTIRFWNIDERREIFARRITPPDDQRTITVAYSPDGRQLAYIQERGRVGIVDPVNGSMIRVLHEGTEERMSSSQSTRLLSWSADGRRLAAVLPTGEAVLWDVETGEVVTRKKPINGANLMSVAVLPDGRQIGMGTTEGVQLWTADGNELRALSDSMAPGVAWTHDGRRLIGVGPYTELFTVALIHPEQKQPPIFYRGATRWANSYSLSPDGTRLAAGCDDGSVCVWDTESHAMVARFDEFDRRCIDVSWSPDGTRLTATTYGKVIVRDIRAGMERTGHAKTITWLAERVITSRKLEDVDRLSALAREHRDFPLAIDALTAVSTDSTVGRRARKHLVKLRRLRACDHRSEGDIEAAEVDEAHALELSQTLLTDKGDYDAIAEDGLLKLQRRDRWSILRASQIESVYGTRVVQDADGFIHTIDSDRVSDAFALTIPGFDTRFNQLRIELLPPGETEDIFQVADWTMHVVNDNEAPPKLITPESINVSENVFIPEAVPPDRPLPIMRWNGIHFSRLLPKSAVWKLPTTTVRPGDELRIRIAFVALPRGKSGAATRFRVSVTESDRAGQELVAASLLPLLDTYGILRAAIAVRLLRDNERLQSLAEAWDPPQSRPMQLLSASCALDRGQVEQAADLLESALQTTWSGPESHLPDLINLVYAVPPLDDVLSRGVDRAALYRLRAALHAQQARADEAIADYERAQAVVELNGRELWLLSLCYRAVGDFEHCEQVSRRHVEINPGDLWTWNRLARTLGSYSLHLEAEGDYRGALEKVTEAIDVTLQGLDRNALLEDRSNERAHSQMRADLDTNITRKIRLLQQLGVDDDIQHCWEESIRNLERGVEDNIDWVYQEGMLNSLAWTLANCPVKSLRDPRRAVAAATQAVELNDESSTYLNTLAVAHYRNDDLDEALSCFDRSQEAGGGGTAFDWYFRAMLHHRLGDDVQARFWLRRAIKWNGEQAQDNAELARFRDEAEQLLDLTTSEPEAE